MRRATIIALALLGAACTQTSDLSGPRVIDVDTGATPAAHSLSPSIKGLLDQTSPSYVTIIVHKTERRKKVSRSDILPDAVTSGSGFVIDGSGHVMTAGHVAVKKGYTVDARGADGKIYQGRVIGVRKNDDMAMIRLSNFSGTPVRPAASTCLTRGQPVFSLGKPHARGDTARIGELHSMSFGRPVTYDGFGYPDAMVLRMSTKKGESGGPVFNERGELTGMVVSTLSDGNGRPLNLAHALPMSRLADFVCTTTSCSSSWKALAAQSEKSCRS